MADLTWKAMAEEVLAKGDYQPGNPWERRLNSHLRSNFPQDWTSLNQSRELKDYLIVRTASAYNRMDQLLDQGTPADVAQELALSELLQLPPDKTPKWELEGAQEDIFAAVSQFLENLSPSPGKHPGGNEGAQRGAK